MGIHRKFMGNSWKAHGKFMEIHGNSWKRADGKFMGIHGNPWKFMEGFMEIHGNSWKEFMESLELSMNRMDSWKFMEGFM